MKPKIKLVGGYWNICLNGNQIYTVPSIRYASEIWGILVDADRRLNGLLGLR